MAPGDTNHIHHLGEISLKSVLQGKINFLDQHQVE